MRQGKRLTREMKILLAKNGYEPESYLWTRMTKYTITFMNKKTNNTVVIERD